MLELEKGQRGLFTKQENDGPGCALYLQERGDDPEEVAKLASFANRKEMQIACDATLHTLKVDGWHVESSCSGDNPWWEWAAILSRKS